MSTPRAALTAAAPLLLLIVLSLSFRLLPLLLGEAAGEEAPAVAPGGAPGRDRLSSPPAPAYGPVDAGTQVALEKTVRTQLGAIRERDFTAALATASPTVRPLWTPAKFGVMIADGFAPMMNSTGEAFEDAQRSGNSAVLRAVVRVRGGRQERYQYVLTRHGDRWFVSACMPEASGFSPPIVPPSS